MNQPRTTNRREFLVGKSAVEALAGRLGLDDEPENLAFAPPSAEEAYLVRIGRRAMACEFEVILNAGEYADATDRALEALDLVEQLESQLTVYRDSSEIAQINRSAAGTEVAAEPRLFQLLCEAAELHRQTDGAFDITTGPLIRAWGFYQRQGTIPDESALRDAWARVGMRHLVLDQERTTVRLAIDGVEINLGAIGKGYALDRAAEHLQACGVANFLLHGGQSSVLARGNQHAGGRGWPIGIRDPLRINRRLAEIALRDRALGTSGSAVQFFRREGRRYGHILDPRTGRPAEGVLSATAVAPTAAQADALATAFYVLGVEKTLAYCDTHPGIGAVMIGSPEGRETPGIYWAGLDDQEIRFVE